MKALISLAVAISIRDDPDLKTYDDSTYLTGHYAGEGSEQDLGYPVDYEVPSYGKNQD